MKIERQARVQRVLDFGYFFSHKSTPFGGPCRVLCNKANSTNSPTKLDGDLAVACFFVRQHRSLSAVSVGTCSTTKIETLCRTLKMITASQAPHIFYAFAILGFT
jgi:hypothetical protein